MLAKEMQGDSCARAPLMGGCNNTKRKSAAPAFPLAKSPLKLLFLAEERTLHLEATLISSSPIAPRPHIFRRQKQINNTTLVASMVNLERCLFTFGSGRSSGPTKKKSELRISPILIAHLE
mmetsp:Transcript_3224/g.5901  ORF Transcript_3224/g.5901 Transcript_3224/m.5901 type:complete len:121 (+) Transcript_3224:384-746(+)